MGFWGLGFHFQRKGGGFRREKRGKLFSFSSARGSSTGKGVVSSAGGSFVQEELFRRARKQGVVVFQRGRGLALQGWWGSCWQDFSEAGTGRVPAGWPCKGGWGSRRRGTTTMEEKYK